MFKLVSSNERLLRRIGTNSLLSRVLRPDPRLFQITRDRALAERIISSLFVDHARISKETAPGRFRDLDHVLATCLRDTPNPVIHDVAVSSGITSMDLLECLHAHGISPRLYISDKFTRCLHTQRGLVARLYDSSGSLLYGRVGAILADPLASWRFPLSRLLFLYLSATRPRTTRTVFEELLLYDPSVRAALRSGALTHLDYDVLLTCEDIRFDVIRCMNTITRRYFPAPEIARAVANLRRSLKPCGLLLVGRTLPGGRNDASLYRLDHGSFLHERVVNDGADIDDIVRGLTPQLHSP